MHIALDGRIFGQQRVSGIGNVMLLLAGGLVAKGIAVTLVSDAPVNDHYSGLLPEVDVMVEKGIFSERFYWEQVVLPKLLRNKLFDVYHAVWNFGLPKKDLSIPSVVTVHDLIPLLQEGYFDSARLPAIARKLHEFSYQVSIEKANRVVCVSDSTQRDVLRVFPGIEKKLSVIHNAIDFDTVVVGEASRLGELGIAGDYFMYIGGFEMRKNVSLILDAFAKFAQKNDEMQLALVGRKDFEYGALIKKVKQQGLGDRVVFVGTVSDAEKWRLYSDSMGLIFPSRSEGFGLPILEAMHFGIPIYASDILAHHEVGADSIEYGDVDDSAALRDFMNDVYEGKITASREGYAERLEHFSASRLVDDYLEVYRSLV